MLGTLGADRDGSALPLPSRRQRAVLAALLTRAGRPVPADELVEAAWGERLPDHPRAALQTVVSRLRTALGAGLISADLSGYRLNVTADGVDALRFEALRELTGALLRACPEVRIIATSRHRLELPDEQVLPLDPLLTGAADVPVPRLRDTAPVRLFIDRMRRVRPALPVTAETVALSAAVCRRLDGVPLAIELAAAQAAAAGLAPVLDRLGDLDVLADADGGIRAVLDRSWALLTRGEQELLARLSVFAAGFDLEAVEHAGGPAAVMRLARLADASLLHVTHEHGHARYRMLAIVRAFAAEQLRADGAAGPARTAHARWIRDLAEAAAADVRAGGAESVRHWRQLLELPGVPAPLQVDAHATFALLACFQSDQPAARQHAEQALTAAREAGPVRAFATYTMGEVRLLEDPAAAVEILELAATQAEAGRTAQIAEVARIALVSALVRLGRHDEALRVLPDLLHQLRRRGGWPQLWTSLRILAELLEALGRPRDAALLLASASADPSAPPVTGDDIPRYRELQRRITGQIGTDAHQRLADQAALLNRAQVLDRALAALPDTAPG